MGNCASCKAANVVNTKLRSSFEPPEPQENGPSIVEPCDTRRETPEFPSSQPLDTTSSTMRNQMEDGYRQGALQTQDHSQARIENQAIHRQLLARERELNTRLNQIREVNPTNRMAKYFDMAYFTELPQQEQTALIQCCMSGLENPDSSLGACKVH